MKKELAEMPILRVEHHVPNFDAWKQAFDIDPAGRRRSGVRRYQVLRSIDDPNFVMVDLGFESTSEAETFVAAMREVWRRVEGTVMWYPQARISEVVERTEY